MKFRLFNLSHDFAAPDAASQPIFLPFGMWAYDDTILQLGRAGFVDLVRVAPNTILLDLDSWYRHLADCMNDPDRWDEGKEDRETYLNANGLGGWKRFV